MNLREVHAGDIAFLGFSLPVLLCAAILALPALSYSANASKVNIGYAAFTGGYAPLWIVVADGLGRQYGLDLECVYGGRISPDLLLDSGELQYTVQSGFGTVQTYARGRKDDVIIASFSNTSGFSIYTKPQITKSGDLRAKSLPPRVRGI